MRTTIRIQQRGSKSLLRGSLLLLFNVFSHIGTRWGEHRTTWLNLFPFISCRYRVYLITYWQVSCPDWHKDTEQGALTLPPSGTFRQQTSRQQGQTSGCYWETRVILERHIVEVDFLYPQREFKVLESVHFIGAAFSSYHKTDGPKFFCLSVS